MSMCCKHALSRLVKARKCAKQGHKISWPVPSNLQVQYCTADNHRTMIVMCCTVHGVGAIVGLILKLCMTDSGLTACAMLAVWNRSTQHSNANAVNIQHCPVRSQSCKLVTPSLSTQQYALNTTNIAHTQSMHYQRDKHAWHEQLLQACTHTLNQHQHGSQTDPKTR